MSLFSGKLITGFGFQQFNWGCCSLIFLICLLKYRVTISQETSIFQPRKNHRFHFLLPIRKSSDLYLRFVGYFNEIQICFYTLIEAQSPEFRFLRSNFTKWLKNWQLLSVALFYALVRGLICFQFGNMNWLVV